MYEIDNQKLKEARRIAQMRQSEVANVIGKSPKDVSHYEQGRAKPPGDVLLNYLIAFNLKPSDVAKKI